MSVEENRRRIVQYWWTKAESSLGSAERELAANELSFAMNGIYYCAFYDVSAVLLDRESSFKKHNGVRSAFHRKLIKTGLLDIEWSKFYDQLYEDRQEIVVVLCRRFSTTNTFIPNLVRNLYSAQSSDAETSSPR